MPEDCGVHLDEAEGELRRVWIGVPVVGEEEEATETDTISYQ
jgi:hypothetical protein